MKLLPRGAAAWGSPSLQGLLAAVELGRAAVGPSWAAPTCPCPGCGIPAGALEELLVWHAPDLAVEPWAQATAGHELGTLGHRGAVQRCWSLSGWCPASGPCRAWLGRRKCPLLWEALPGAAAVSQHLQNKISAPLRVLSWGFGRDIGDVIPSGGGLGACAAENPPLALQSTMLWALQQWGPCRERLRAPLCGWILLLS